MNGEFRITLFPATDRDWTSLTLKSFLHAANNTPFLPAQTQHLPKVEISNYDSRTFQDSAFVHRNRHLFHFLRC